MKKMISLILTATFALTLMSCSQAVNAAAASAVPASAKADAGTLAPFVIFADDSKSSDAKDRFGDIAYMGSHNDGNDKSITVTFPDEREKYTGKSSLFFSYTPKSTTHWSGAMLLYAKDKISDNPGSAGPDLKKYTKVTFYIKGDGGTVKVFTECDGTSEHQKSAVITLTKEWTKVTFELDAKWAYSNIPLGWACNEKDPATKGGTINFWIDALQFE